MLPILAKLFRRGPEPFLLHCLRCGASTEFIEVEDIPMTCPNCGADFGARRVDPTGVLTIPAELDADGVDRIRQRFDETCRARDAGLEVSFYAGEDCS